MQGQTVTQEAHDMIAIGPDTDGDSSTTKYTGEYGLAWKLSVNHLLRLTESRWGQGSQRRREHHFAK